MAADSGSSLSGLAGQILREAVRAYQTDDIERMVMGYNPVAAAWNTGMFAAAGDMTSSFNTVGFAASREPEISLSRVFRLGKRLPAVRLPAVAELAAQARTAPYMATLEALALWLGQDGRPVTAADELSPADAAEAARVLGIGPEHLPYLWEYALTARWVEFADGDGDGPSRAVPGFTAWRWASGDDFSTLRAWTAVFAAVLAQALEIRVAAHREAARKLRFQGQGVVVAMLLFLDRRTGMTVAGIGDVVRADALGGRKSARARRHWDAWVRQHGDPVRWLLGELAALGAVELPATDDGAVALAPPALWALREQLRLEGIEIPQITAVREELRAADVVNLADSVPRAEFEAEVGAWVAGRGEDQAGRDLLAFATFAGPQLRLVAVNLTRRLGVVAYRAWREALPRPELRGYARLALSSMAAGLPESTQPMAVELDPDDLAVVATDLLALACGEWDPDPAEIAAQFAAAVPSGEERQVIEQLSRSSHPDAAAVLAALGRHHPDRELAKEARRAARAARGRPAARADRVPASAAGL